MSEIKGMGLCGICHKPIQDEKTGAPTGPIRHLSGHTLAHKGCFDAHEAEKSTTEYQLRQAEERVTRAEARVTAAKAELTASRLDLKRIKGD